MKHPAAVIIIPLLAMFFAVMFGITGNVVLLAADDKSGASAQEQRRRPDNSLGISFEHQPSEEFDLKKYTLNGRVKLPIDSPVQLFIDTRGEMYDTETGHEFPERLYSLSLSLSRAEPDGATPSWE